MFVIVETFIYHLTYLVTVMKTDLVGAGGLVASLQTAEWKLIYVLCRAAFALTNLSLLI